MKLHLLIIFCLFSQFSFAQRDSTAGIIAGNLLGINNSKAIEGASVIASDMGDAQKTFYTFTDKDGAFEFAHLPFGYYRLSISSLGFAPVRIDSIYVRRERSDFNLADIKLSTMSTSTDLSAVIVYAEKPLYENKDGKITFNASESALSNSSSATDLLKQTPLVSVDEDGKLLMRGKEVKVLIDDKPVELDARQLQDLLESMPGSMIEKIEVLTTPPPQYANERGGVINIVTKKGKVGFSARLNVAYGTRGEGSTSGNVNYRKNKLSLNFNVGYSYNEYRGVSYSNRQNMYADSTNYFNTTGSNNSRTRRPNSRLSVDYQLTKQSSLNATLLYNANNNGGLNNTRYSNINRFEQLYKLSSRTVGSETESGNPSAAFTYTFKGKNIPTIFTVNGSAAWGSYDNLRNYYQQFLFPDGSFTGTDSTQQQNTHTTNRTYSLRINYDRPLANNKYYLSVGGNVNYYHTYNTLHTAYLKKPENVLTENPVLSNEFDFYQAVYAVRMALRYEVKKNFFITAGLQQEYSRTSFDIVNNANNYANPYYSSLPFATLNKKWENDFSLTVSYKRSIKRPGISNLNPSVDYSDPYNTRFGNPFLQPYYSDNFDVIGGYWNKKYNVNLSIGYNALQQIFSSIRTLQADGKTFTTWQNLSGRKEYESSAWGGFNIGKKVKATLSAGYSYNVYSEHDRKVNRFRNGGSLTSSVTGNYTVNPLLTMTGNFAYRRFANPQGSLRSTLSMSLGIQQKLFKKNLSVSLNIIDPFRQQQNKYFTYGPGYTLESFYRNNSRNYKLGLAYTFKKATKKMAKNKNG